MTDAAVAVRIDAFPTENRLAVWRDALAGLSLDASAGAPLPSSSEIGVRHSSSGARLGFIRSGPQRLAPVAGRSVPLVGIALAVDGRGRLGGPFKGSEIVQGDLLILDMQGQWTIDWHGDHELQVLMVPGARVTSRLGRIALGPPRVLGACRAAAAARSALRILGPDVGTIAQHELSTLETVITELVSSAVLTENKDDGGPGRTPAHDTMFRRVAAAVEARLADPVLGPADIARQEGLSLRSLQRLFETNGDSFSDYLRRRRLARCESDLADPSCEHQSIAEVAWRWGYRDQAHFSKAFKAFTGSSPTQFRQRAKPAMAGHAWRGRPKSGVHAATGRAMAPGVRAEPVDAPPPATTRRWPDIPPRDRAPPGAEHQIPARPDTVHWGFLSRSLPPVLRVHSGDVVTVETLTQHGCDDWGRFIEGDPDAEAVFRWNADAKGVERRGAGPMNASIFGRGAGEGFGVHILTGPIAIAEAEAGDVLEIEFLDIAPRPCRNPAYAGKAFASNVSAWWGFQYNDPLKAGAQREVVTIYEIDLADAGRATPSHAYRWRPQTDPYGIIHDTMDYPGIPVDPATVETVNGVLAGVSVPARLHFGFVAVAPREEQLVDTIPPSYFGGNLDNRWMGPGSRLFLPVAVAGALLSVGDGHFSQGDGEINGTGLECSLTGRLRLRVHKRDGHAGAVLQGLAAPLIETEEVFVIQAFSYLNYLRELGRTAQSDVYSRSTLDLAMRAAFRQTRRFLMDAYHLTEDEALSLMSVAVDFGVTQVADGNFGIHAVIRKAMFDTPPAAIRQPS